jgi:hypothetical protein
MQKIFLFVFFFLFLDFQLKRYLHRIKWRLLFNEEYGKVLLKRWCHFLGVEFLLFLNIINSPKYQNAYFFVVHEFVLYVIFVEHEFVVYVIINPTHYTAVPWTWTSVGWYTSEEVPSYSREMVCLWIVILFALSVFLWYRNFYGC